MSLPVQIGRFGINTTQQIVERAFKKSLEVGAGSEAVLCLELDHGRITLAWRGSAHDEKVFASFRIGSDPDWLAGEIDYVRLNTGSRKRKGVGRG